ncbi:MAG: 30S ribosomal protein S6 [Desulfuromonadales bacterium]|nr:30S ribosomal protein S6 [Desulfuromonadales bacterium]
MRIYESIFIVHPDIVGDEQTAIIDKYTTILTNQGAEVLKLDNWGVRTLAYPVKKQTKGCFVLVIFEAGPKVIAEYERRMRIDEKVIKFQTVILEGGYEAPPVVEAAPEDASTEAEEGVAETAETSESTEEAVEPTAETVTAAEEKTEEV